LRRAFVDVASEHLQLDSSSILLLGDIGVHGFSAAKKTHPTRVVNIGILEQSMVSVAAGLALGGLRPIVHTIAPFLVERAFEQLKVDFGYQSLAGNFVTVGASYDYSSLGATHHCPADVRLLLSIPNFQIFVPGSSLELQSLYRQASPNDSASYFRLSEVENSVAHVAGIGKATILRQGLKALILVWGPMLNAALDATEGLDVTILYFNSCRPLDRAAIRENFISNSPVICIEPFYTGTMGQTVIDALEGNAVELHSIGVPVSFIHTYGSRPELESSLGLDATGIRAKLKIALR
jgi:transketolase